MLPQTDRRFRFLIVTCVVVAVAAAVSSLASEGAGASYDYCIVGAGPGGLQAAYFLQRAQRSYVVLEKEGQAGSFFTRFPRLRRLISINKRHTGSNDTGRPFFTLEIQLVSTSATDTMECSVVVWAAGFSIPRRPHTTGSELVTTYDVASTNATDYTGQNVLIIGKGNSAFEMADMLTHEANFIHVVSRNPVRLSYFTHYVGDARAVNNKFLDHYQLKSLDAALDMDMEKNITYQYDNDAKIIRVLLDGEVDKAFFESHPLRKGYHKIIACMGWQADQGPFAPLSPSPRFGNKYPEVNGRYESVQVLDLYFAGALMHSRDWRKSSGGFIHGFRYLVQALHRGMEERYHSVPWPHKALLHNAEEVTSYVLDRINSVSSMYQMFTVIGDVMVLPRRKCDSAGNCDSKANSMPVHYIQDVLLDSIHDLACMKNLTEPPRFVVVQMRYGRGFTGEKVLARDRAASDPSESHLSRFLHPVLTEYDLSRLEDEGVATMGGSRAGAQKSQQSQRLDWRTQPWTVELLTRAERSRHHILEDFLTEWRAHGEHATPLRTWMRRLLSDRPIPPLLDVGLDNLDVNLLPIPTTPPQVREHTLATVDVLQAAAKHLSVLNRTRAELLVLELALNLLRKVKGPEHVDVAATELAMTSRLAAVGRVADAKQWYKRGKAILTDTYGRNSYPAAWAEERGIIAVQTAKIYKEVQEQKEKRQQPQRQHTTQPSAQARRSAPITRQREKRGYGEDSEYDEPLREQPSQRYRKPQRKQGRQQEQQRRRSSRGDEEE